MKNELKDVILVSNKLIKNFSNDNFENINLFIKKLSLLSNLYLSNKSGVLLELKKLFPDLYIQIVSIVSTSDSIIALTEGENGSEDYILVIDIFRNLIVTLDTISSTYWSILQDKFLLTGTKKEYLQELVTLSNISRFKSISLTKTEKDILTKLNIKEDLYFKNEMNKELWESITEINDKIFEKQEETREELIAFLENDQNFMSNLILKLLYALAISFSYIDYVNNLLEG